MREERGKGRLGFSEKLFPQHHVWRGTRGEGILHGSVRWFLFFLLVFTGGQFLPHEVKRVWTSLRQKRIYIDVVFFPLQGGKT